MTSVYGPDPNGMARPRRIRHAKGAQVLYDSGFFDYDGTGNIWKTGTDRFVYDRVSRLTLGTVKQAGAGLQETYTYDAFDNVLSRVRNSSQTDTYPIDSKNRMRGLDHDIAYDRAGQMTQVGLLLDGTPNISMEWDGLGMQLAFKRHSPSFQQQVYVYGPGNLRLLSFDSRDGAPDLEPAGPIGQDPAHLASHGVFGCLLPGFGVRPRQGLSLRARKACLPAARPLAKPPTSTMNHLGSPRLITNSLAQAIGRHHYYPFGQEVFPEVPYDDRICKFTGHERDPNGATDYMLGRNYAFSFQRFLSVDPARDGWNLYAYVGNNPVGAVDPTGQAAETAWDATNVAVGTVSLIKNVNAGNTGAALVDFAGLLVDAAAAAIPFVPGGASVLIELARTGEGLGVPDSDADIPDDAPVVRGGIATEQQISNGIGPHRDVPGLEGFSAQSRAGASVDELARTGGVGGGPFPHGQVSVSTAGQLRCVGCDVVPSPGAGANHVTVTPGGATPAEISRQFTQRSNSARRR